MTGISVCVITNAKRPAITAAAILSIAHAARQVPGLAAETIVCGIAEPFAGLPLVRTVDATDAASTGKLGLLRNAAVAAATGEIVVVIDDDIFLPETFFQRLLQFDSAQPSWQILDTRVFDTHDSIMHARTGTGLLNSGLIGGFMIARREVLDRFRWNEDLAAHAQQRGEAKENEDVEFSRRLNQASQPIDFDAGNFVWHWNTDHTEGDCSIRFLEMMSLWKRLKHSTSSKRCYLVFGAESSGTRFFTECCIAAGAFGDATHAQRLDALLEEKPGARSQEPEGTTLPSATDNWQLTTGNLFHPIVWRRSFPHGDFHPGAAAMLDRLREGGYDDVRVFWTIRDIECSVKSQLAAGHVESEAEARSNIEQGNLLIGKFLRDFDLPVQIVRYEKIVADPSRIQTLLARWGLMLDRVPQIIDGNAKYKISC